MTRYIETTGKTEEAAVAAALEQLGLERDDVSVEVLERARTGFLGIGSVPARVRVSYEAPEEPETPCCPTEEAPCTCCSGEKATPAAERKAESHRAPEEDDGVVEDIRSFLAGLLHHMFVDAEIRISPEGEEDTYRVELSGENMSAIIGRRGETLDAIQQLTGYAVNRTRSRRVRIHLDTEGYRAKREETLIRLANKVAGKVTKYHRSVTLEPMNAYERHVIHTALQDVPGITTYSVGSEPNRRTVVAWEK